MIEEDVPVPVPTVPAEPVTRSSTQSYVELDDVITDVGDESAIADSTAMFIMEFLP